MANSIQYKLYLPPGSSDESATNEQVIFDFVDQVRHYTRLAAGRPTSKRAGFRL